MKNKKIYLTQGQLGRIVENIINEVTGTDALTALDKKGLENVKPIKPIKVKVPVKTTGGPTGLGVTTNVGSPNQVSAGEGTPNTTGGDSVAGLNDMFAPMFTDNIGYEKTITNNIKYQQPTDFKGVNPTYLPGEANDKGANLKLTGDFGVEGVKLDTHSGPYDIKIAQRFTNDMKKGKMHKKSKVKHAELHPNRHKNATRIKNVVHPDGITRGGVTFDSSFKPGKGGDPFTVKS